MEAPQNECWIGIEQAAQYLGVKPSTIRDWIRNNNGIPAHKVGKMWRFKISDLDEWVKSDKKKKEDNDENDASKL